jgi:hypothetical protein
MSSFEKPITATRMPPRSSVRDGAHSGGVLPVAESTMLAETYLNVASGISSLRRYCSPRSKLWLPRPSKVKPILFMSSMVGLSPKAAEMGGVAPTASPAVTVKVRRGFSAR